jgi:hypothetical protein
LTAFGRRLAPSPRGFPAGSPNRKSGSFLPHPRRNPRSRYPKTIHTEMDEFSTEFSKCADEILSLQDGRSQSCRIAMATMSPRFRRAGNKFRICHIHAALASTMVA